MKRRRLTEMEIPLARAGFVRQRILEHQPPVGSTDDLDAEVYGENLRRLGSAERQVSEDWKEGVIDGPHNLRQCYPNALLYAVDHHNIEGMRLVQGVNNLFGEHAWVELPNNIVFDGVLQRFYAQDRYYSTTSARKEAEYTWEAATSKYMISGGHGPWHSSV